MANDNRLLGQFNLEGIPLAPRGVPQIEVRFDIDQNGILNVAAKTLVQAKKRQFVLSSLRVYPKDEINRMRRDAETHAADDKAKLELVELRNQASQMCFQVENDERARRQAQRSRSWTSRGSYFCQRGVANGDECRPSRMPLRSSSKLHML